MPVECTFTLNKTAVSILNCPGFGSVAAFSGNGRYVNDPAATAITDKGPLPTGTYYIVDRQSGSLYIEMMERSTIGQQSRASVVGISGFILLAVSVKAVVVLQ